MMEIFPRNWNLDAKFQPKYSDGIEFELPQDDGPPTQIAMQRTKGLPVSLKGVAKAFGERRVLEPFDLEVGSGEFVAVVGRSGGGKTTLMRLIAGLTDTSAGAIHIDGKPVNGLQSTVRLLFQDARLLPWQTV
ncbi:MAG: ATP-binding cassette domain-containing protein, partial [Chitinophagales bacterium]|nr:ATP-binding cassette domain-containing protein [Hyphomicrobiales bacterium]